MEKANKKNFFILFIFSTLLTLNFITFEHKFISNPNIYYITINNQIFKYLIKFIFLTILFFIIFNIFFEDIKYNYKIKNLILFLILISFLLIGFRFKIYEYNLLIFYFNFLLLGIFIIQNEGWADYKNDIDDKRISFILLIITILIIIMSFIRIKSYHNTFHTNASDLGIFMNTLFLLNNNELGYTLIESYGYGSRFYVHFDWFLYILSFFYKVIKNPEFYLFLQVLIVFSAGFIIYLLTNLLLGNKIFSFLLSLSYLISPLTVASIDFDFHLDPFYPLFIFCFVYFNLQEKYFLSVIFFILSISLKEEISIYIFFITFFLFLYTKRKFNFILLFVSSVYAITVIKFIMPELNSTTTHWQNFLNSIFNNMSLVFNMEKILNVFFYLGGHLLFWPFLSSLTFLLIFFPPSFIHYFHPRMYDIQYAALVLPSVFLSGIFSIKLNQKKLNYNDLTKLGFLILFVTIGLNYFKTPNLNLYENIFLIILILLIPYFVKNKLKILLLIFLCFICVYVFNRGYYRYNRYRATINPERKKILNEIILNYLEKDKEMAIIANLNIVPHISDRKYILTLEDTHQQLLIKLNYNRISKFLLFYDGNFDTLQTQEKFNYFKENFKNLKTTAKKIGYKERILFNKENIVVLKFEK